MAGHRLKNHKIVSFWSDINSARYSSLAFREGTAQMWAWRTTNFFLTQSKKFFTTQQKNYFGLQKKVKIKEIGTPSHQTKIPGANKLFFLIGQKKYIYIFWIPPSKAFIGPHPKIIKTVFSCIIQNPMVSVLFYHLPFFNNVQT